MTGTESSYNSLANQLTVVCNGVSPVVLDMQTKTGGTIYVLGICLLAGYILSLVVF